MLTRKIFHKICKPAGIVAVSTMLIFSTPGVSLGGAWGKVLSDAELGKVYAQGLRVDWKMGITATSTGRFNLNFNAQGSFKQKAPGNNFLAELGLFGGLFGVKADENSKNTPKQEATIPIVFQGVEIGEITTSIEAKGGKPTGNPVEIVQGPAGGANMNLFSLNGSGIASKAKIDVLLSKSGGLGGTGASMTRTIRNAVCSGCLEESSA